MKKIVWQVIKKLYFPYIWSIACTLAILYLSLGKMPDNEDIKINIPHLDKVVHFMMYFFYTCILQIDFYKKKKSTIVTIALYSILFGLLMEILQNYIFTYRSGEIYDMLFNSLGVLAAIVVIQKLKLTKTLFLQNQQHHP